MTERQTLLALQAIGLRGEAKATGDSDYRRVFVYDHENTTIGRLTIFRGEYSHAKWYVSAVSDGPRVLDDERVPHAWGLWLRSRQRLPVERWRTIVAEALRQARAERDEKQAWREANPVPKRRKRLQLNVRKFVNRELYGDSWVSI